MSSRKIAPALKAVEKKRQELLAEIARPEPVIVGTVVDALRRCGNPTCRCVEKPTHRQTLLLCTVKGKRTSRFVRQKDADRVRKGWERYRRCKSAIRELRALNKRELELLRAQIELRRTPYD